MSRNPGLEQVQQWFQSVVVDPAPPRDEDAASVILPSPTLSPAERIGIYQGMYPLRMEEALASDYPGLKHFIGDHAFHHFVGDYVQHHPSRSYTLNRLGDHVPEFIASREAFRWRDFCHDLARLELAITDVFDADEVPTLTAPDIEAIPPGAWGEMRLAPVPAFRLLALRYPVNAYLQSVKDDDHDHPKPRRHDNWVAIHRRNLALYRLELTRPAHGVLASIVGGMPLGDAIEKAVTRRGRGKPSADELFRWFREWVSGGIFRSVPR